MFESVSVACVRAPVCMLLSEAEFFLLLFIVPHIEQWNAPCRKRTFIVPTDRRKNPYALRSTARLSRYRWRWPVQCNTTTFPIPSSCPSVAVLRPDAFELGTTAVRLPPPSVHTQFSVWELFRKVRPSVAFAVSSDHVSVLCKYSSSPTIRTGTGWLT